MGELTTSRVWDTEPKDGPSKYARMTLGTSALQPPRFEAVETPHSSTLGRDRSDHAKTNSPCHSSAALSNHR